MGSFTEIFGGSPVSPAEVAFASYEFSADLTLVWPQFSNGNPNVAARFMQVRADVDGLNIFMPDATLASVGYDTIIFNNGGDTINIEQYISDPGSIVSIFSGEAYYIILVDNSTQGGTWQVVQFGTGTSSADASALAGAGLLALAGQLAVNLDVVMVSTSFSLTAVSRDVLQVWTGGSGTITLPSSSAIGNGFLFPIANNGSGSVTIAPVGGDLIDGASSSVFTQTQSGFIVSTGSGWVTIGKGIQNTFAVTLLNLSVAGSADVTETSAQAQNIIQQYTGALTGNINVIVPNTVQIYFIYNETSGAFTLTVKTAAGAGVSVAQGSHAILYCDGTNVVNAFTATITSTLTIPSGSASSPALNVSGSLTTGLFSAAANTISVSAGGNEVTRYASAASAVNHLTETSSATGQSVLIGAEGTDGTIPITIAGKGGAPVNFPNAAITGGTVNGAVIGGSTPAAIAGTIITANTGFVGPLTGNVTGNLTGHASLDLASANNLSDVQTPATALFNIGGLSVTTAASTYAPLASPHLTGTPLAPTAASNTSTTQLATTAFANPASLQSANGYATLPCGIIMQWGTVFGVGNGSVVTVTLPVAFPNNFYNASFSQAAAGGSATVHASAISPLGLDQLQIANQSGITQAYYWQAIGN